MAVLLLEATQVFRELADSNNTVQIGGNPPMNHDKIENDIDYIQECCIVIKKHDHYIYRYILFLAEGRKADADEIHLQWRENVIRGIMPNKNRPTLFRPHTSFSAWMRRIARRTFVKYNKKRDVILNIDVRLNTSKINKISDRSVSTSTIRNREREERINYIIENELNPDERKLLNYRIQGKSWLEIEKIYSDNNPEQEDLKIKAATLRKRYQRLIEYIRKRCEDF